MYSKITIIGPSLALALLAGVGCTVGAGIQSDGKRFGVVVGSAESFETSDASYVLGDQTGEDGSLTNTQVYFDSAESRIEPMHTGWGLYRAEIPNLETSLLLTSAHLLGIYVQKCGTDEWINIKETPYWIGSPVVERVYEENGVFIYEIDSYPTVYPGTKINAELACGDEYVTINTYIGPQTLQASGIVQFAYVVEHF